MTKINQIYKCNLCGNIAGVVHEAEGELVCCGQKMELLPEKTSDEGKEKHVPVIEKTESGILVKIGSISHPMEEGHYIEWIEIIAGDANFRKFLNPGDKPKAEFKVSAENIEARAYCNIHGFWTSKI